MGLLEKTVWERNIWLETGDSEQIKMVLFREVGAFMKKGLFGVLVNN